MTEDANSTELIYGVSLLTQSRAENHLGMVFFCPGLSRVSVGDSEVRGWGLMYFMCYRAQQ